MIDSDDLAIFKQAFTCTEPFVDKARLAKRRKAEKRAQMSERQLSRGGRKRDAQLNIRTTGDVKTLASKLAETMDMSLAELIELAITELASKKGVK